MCSVVVVELELRRFEWADLGQGAFLGREAGLGRVVGLVRGLELFFNLCLLLQPSKI